jgi:hypothetical protein
LFNNKGRACIFGNVLKNSWWYFVLKALNFAHQSQGETSSAGEQLVSNKIDPYTVSSSSVKELLLLFITGMANGFKNSFVIG